LKSNMLYSNLESFYLRYPGFGLFILDNVSRESNNTVVPVCSVMWCLQTTLTIHEAFYSVCIIPHLSTSCSKSLCGKHGSSKSKDPHDAKFGGITRDFKVLLLDDFVFEPSENFNSIFLKIDFSDSIDFKQV